MHPRPQNRRIFDGVETYVVAEIGNNHGGSVERAVRMIEAASRSGVSAVKFQKRNNPKLFSGQFYNSTYNSLHSYGQTYGEHREHLEFDRDEYKQLKAAARSANVDFIVTPFDLDSLELLEGIGVDAYKIASADVTNHPLICAVASTGMPLMISTGACTLQKVAAAYDLVDCVQDVCLLHCVSLYPTLEVDLNLKRIGQIAELAPRASVGFSGHDDGIRGALYARCLGAKVIEKHFTDDRSAKGTDNAFSLTEATMAELVSELSHLDKMLNSSDLHLLEREIRASSKMMKGIYAARPLKKGALIRAEDCVFKSPMLGLSPDEIGKVVGRRILHDIEADTPIRLPDLSPETKSGDQCSQLRIAGAANFTVTQPGE